MTKTLTTIALAAFASFPAAQAGEVVAVPTPAPVVMTDSVSSLSGTLSGGWESNYMFRGVSYGRQAVWAGLDTNIALSDTLTFNVGTWYINPTDDNLGDYDELDIYAFLGIKVTEELTISIGGTWYFYPEPTTADFPEIGVKIAYSPAGIVDLNLMYMYDTNVTANYFEFSVGKSFDLTERLSAGVQLGISAGEGGGRGYYGIDGGNHWYAKAALTYAVTDTFSITGYVADEVPYDVLEDAGTPEVFHGGVSVSVTF